jgi:MoxR-like ATPase
MTLSVIEKNGSIRFPHAKTSSHKKSHHRPPAPPSPFLANICIIENLQEVEHPEQVLQVIHEAAVVIDGEEIQVPRPSVIVALVPQGTHLPKTVATSFTFHINIPTFPDDHNFPPIKEPCAPTFEALLAAVRGPGTGPAFMHKELSIYLGKLVLRADCTPLVTSFLTVPTKLLLVRAIEDYAMLHGRAFITPDDVQQLFPCLVTHLILLPGITTFGTCVQFVNSIIEEVEVPV